VSNIITGAIAVLLASLFLLLYAVKLSSVALTVIIVTVIAMMCFDFIQSIRSGGD
jgi:hypothetical protein